MKQALSTFLLLCLFILGAKDISGASSYGHDFLRGFSMKNEIAKIKNGDYTSPLLSFIIYQKIDSGFYTWDKNFATLFPAYPNQTLKASQQATIFEGKFEGLKGLFKLYYGYRIKGAAADDIYYNKDHAFNFRVY